MIDDFSPAYTNLYSDQDAPNADVAADGGGDDGGGMDAEDAVGEGVLNRIVPEVLLVYLLYSHHTNTTLLYSNSSLC